MSILTPLLCFRRHSILFRAPREMQNNETDKCNSDVGNTVGALCCISHLKEGRLWILVMNLSPDFYYSVFLKCALLKYMQSKHLLEICKGATNMVPVRQELNDDFSFYAKTYDIKLVIQLLKAIKFKDNAVFYCTNEGIKVTVEDMKCLQANSYLEASLFDEYKIKKKTNEDFVKFTTNISVILDCLNILHNSGMTALIISYRTEGSPIKLLMEDGGIITDCKVRTLVTEPVLSFSFESSRTINKVVFFSEFFKEVLSDVDTTSDLLQISITTEPPKFKLTTDGNGVISETDVPCDSEMIDAFYCNTPCQHSYKLAHIKPALKPLQGSLKVSIQIDEVGVLCLQYMIVDEGRTCFVEYFCSAVFKVSVKSG